VCIRRRPFRRQYISRRARITGRCFRRRGWIIKRRVIVPVSLFAVASVCVTSPLSHSEPPPAVKWESIISDQFFPASILSVAGVPANPASQGNQGNTQILCDPKSSFRVAVQSSTPRTRVHVEVKVDNFSIDTSSCDAVLQNAGQTYVVAPTPRWDMHKLANNDQPYPATVVIRVTANGTSLGERTQRLQMRAVNDVPFETRNDQGQTTWFSLDLFGGFVNENSPVVDQLLHEALGWNAVQNFIGYGKEPDEVRMQVFAIWNALQHRGVRYSNIAQPSGFSQKVVSQSVRFVDQTVRSSQANCVDGSVLFASVLYKIGIYPVLATEPDHMFVGYYLDESAVGKDLHVAPIQNLEFLETTLIGGGKVSNRAFDESHKPEDSESYYQFQEAVKTGATEFDKDIKENWRARKPGYGLMSVRNLRARGINPIPR
jgi:hypothetical protein